MRALASSEEARRLDAATLEAWALPPPILMENAAMRLWAALEPLAAGLGAGREAPLLALAGAGNNGGDALALLRQARFAGLRRLGAILVSPELGELAALQAASLRAAGIPLLAWGEPGSAELLSSAALLVDGIAGSGLRGPLRGHALSLARAAVEAGKPIAALDLPSGLGEGMAAGNFILPAAWTLSIEPDKASLYYPGAREAAGQILSVGGVFPADAAFEPAARLLEAGDLEALLPPLPAAAHKGQRGRLGIAAGSLGMAGAACLAARGAQAAGAGLVYLYLPPELFAGFAAAPALPALGGAIIRPESALPAELGRLDALLAGPGWGEDGGRLPLLELLLSSRLPLLLDAGALRLLPSLASAAASREAPLLLSPHPGELEPLSGHSPASSLANPPPALGAAAERFGADIILKAQVSWIRGGGGELRVWEGREASLGVAGSGDVLAGLAGGLLARRAARAELSDSDGLEVLSAAAIAHGLAGRRAGRELGWYEAEALIGEAAKLLGGAA